MAFYSFDKNYPFASRYIDEDFNRLWTRDVLTSKGTSQELTRAKEILPIIEETDILLDLHSMSDDCLPLAMAGIHQKGVDLAKKIGVPEHIIVDPGHSAGARLRDFAPFIAPDNSKAALLVECGQHWRQTSADFAIQACQQFLGRLGLIDEDDGFAPLKSVAPRQQILYVTEAITAAGNNFKFSSDFKGLDKLPTKGTLIGNDGDKAILTPYDDCILIMPTPGVAKGQTAVRLARE